MNIKHIIRLLAVTTPLFVAGCQILFWTSVSPNGLPCRSPAPDDPDQRRCLAGYTCIEEFCILAQAQGEDEDCTVDEECEEGLICRDRYLNTAGQCDSIEYDRICDAGDSSLDNAVSGGLKCRRICDPSRPIDQQCNDGQTCFDDEQANVDGFCQAGNCANDVECGGEALCLKKEENPDNNDVSGSGVCFKKCDPFNCTPNTGCNTCPIDDDVDGDGQADVMGCEPRDLEFVQNEFDRIVCVKAGFGAPGNTCQEGEEGQCQPGAFCRDGVCATWCNFVSGSPACNGNQVCNPIPNSAVQNLGFCSNQ